MKLVLLGSMARDPIVAGALVMSHRQIPVIVQLSAITNRGRPGYGSRCASFARDVRSSLRNALSRWYSTLNVEPRQISEC